MYAHGQNINNNRNFNLNKTELYLDFSNNRLKILNYENLDEVIVRQIIILAKNLELAKIVHISNSRTINIFRKCGFLIEGIITGFFSGNDGFYVSYFVDSKRSISDNIQTERVILNECLNPTNSNKKSFHSLPRIRFAYEKDIPQLIKLFKRVFKTYPSPIFDGFYLREIINTSVIFKVVEEQGRIVSVVSAEMDIKNANAEVSDCATYPEFRGNGYSKMLISSIEKELKTRNFITLYSIARAINPSINHVFFASGYKYGGMLIKNCHISGGFEDMNIWVKDISDNK